MLINGNWYAPVPGAECDLSFASLLPVRSFPFESFLVNLDARDGYSFWRYESIVAKKHQSGRAGYFDTS